MVSLFRFTTLAFIVAKCSLLALAQGTPNLTPFQPQGWSDKIVISTQTGTHTDNAPLKTTDPIYVDWAVLNNGTASAPSGFQVALYVDGVLRQSWTKSTPQDASFYSYLEDYPLGVLAPGTHSIRLVADSTGAVAESNETDNEYTKTISVTAPPNLTPFQPTGWSDKIVISTLTGTSSDSGAYRTTDSIYVDWAVINNGQGPATASFQIKLFIDGQERVFWNSSPTLESGFYNFIQDYPIGPLSAGLHTIRIQADPFNAVTETNETDNDYTKTISVVQATQCFTLLTAVNPAAGGTITKPPPNCGAAISSATESLSAAEPTLLTANAVTNLPPPPKRSQATVETFARLRDKVRSQRRVSVIVGLGMDFRPEGALVDSDAVTIQRTSISRVQDELLARISKYDVTSIHKFRFIPYMALEVDAVGLSFLDSSSEVMSISENERLRPLLAESVPLIGAPSAWNSGFSGAGQTVAILDSGVDNSHPFLAGKVVSEGCYSTNDILQSASSTCPNGVPESTAPGSGLPCSISGCDHGTHVAGIAAGKGSTFSGVARDASVIAIKTGTIVSNRYLCEDQVSPCVQHFDLNVIQGLERVYELANTGPFRIAAVNVSLGGGKYTATCDARYPDYWSAIENLRLIGIPTVISSGNKGYPDGLSAPACLSNAVSVGSTNDGSFGTTANQISSFSNSASFLGLLAPGRWITSSVPGGNYLTISGTSMAAPHVAGAWAVLKSKAPNVTVSQALSALRTTGVPIVDLRNGITKPRIQVDAALNALTVGQAAYSGGTNVTLTAVPNTGYQFKSWSGCDSVSGNQCTVTMTKSPSVTANFEPVSTAGADLVLSSLSGSSAVPVGGQISLAAEVKNQGAGNAGSFRLGFYLSTDANITTNDTLIAICDNTSGLSAGYSWTCGGPIALPATLPPASYNLGAIVDDQGKVAESNESNNIRTGPTVLVTNAESATIFVPIVLSAAGLNNSFFTSEITLTNRGNQDAALHFTYTASIGTGTGEATASLPRGQQRIIPDAIAYLQSIGVPLPSSGNRGGTLTVRFTGLSSAADGGVVVRTTSAVSGGRAGLAYLGISSTSALTGTAYLYGLQQTVKDRSNVAIQHMGGPSTGTVTLRLTVFSGTSSNPISKTLPDEVLSPGEFRQISGILAAEGLSLTNGYVRIERVNGAAPYYAYAVVNDQANSDGSFVAPILESTLAGKTSVAVPVIVEANTFTSELVVTNWSTSRKTLNFEYVADAIQTADSTARFRIELEAGEQKIYPDFVQVLRESGIFGVGPRGPSFAGALFGWPSTGDLSGISVSVRTSSPGGGGRYGLFYSGVTNGRASATSAWIYGLQQNADSRSNLALINTGEVDISADTFRIELFNGATGIKVNTIDGVTLKAGGWKQIGTILTEFAPGVTQGYARVTRMSGNNPFIVYGVINDGATSGERTGDGAYIPSSP